jgi:hypothetical protein
LGVPGFYAVSEKLTCFYLASGFQPGARDPEKMKAMGNPIAFIFSGILPTKRE